MAVHVRPIEDADCDRVAELINELAAYNDDVGTMTPDILRRDALGPSPWFVVLVAEVDGAICGYAIIVRTALAQFGDRTANLHHLSVADGARRSGTGRALIEAVREWCVEHGCRYVDVGTHASNGRAQRFYRAVGFEPWPRRDAPRFRMDLR